jgi:hypothetical protein
MEKITVPTEKISVPMTDFGLEALVSGHAPRWKDLASRWKGLTRKRQDSEVQGQSLKIKQVHGSSRAPKRAGEGRDTSLKDFIASPPTANAAAANHSVESFSNKESSTAKVPK